MRLEDNYKYIEHIVLKADIIQKNTNRIFNLENKRFIKVSDYDNLINNMSGNKQLEIKQLDKLGWTVICNWALTVKTGIPYRISKQNNIWFIEIFERHMRLIKLRLVDYLKSSIERRLKGGNLTKLKIWSIRNSIYLSTYELQDLLEQDRKSIKKKLLKQVFIDGAIIIVNNFICTSIEGKDTSGGLDVIIPNGVIEIKEVTISFKINNLEIPSSLEDCDMNTRGVGLVRCENLIIHGNLSINALLNLGDNLEIENKIIIRGEVDIDFITYIYTVFNNRIEVSDKFKINHIISIKKICKKIIKHIDMYKGSRYLSIILEDGEELGVKDSVFEALKIINTRKET